MQIKKRNTTLTLTLTLSVQLEQLVHSRFVCPITHSNYNLIVFFKLARRYLGLLLLFGMQNETGWLPSVNVERQPNTALFVCRCHSHLNTHTHTFSLPFVIVFFVHWLRVNRFFHKTISNPIDIRYRFWQTARGTLSTCRIPNERRKKFRVSSNPLRSRLENFPISFVASKQKLN